jgi:Fe-S cluster assembly protein SufD
MSALLDSLHAFPCDPQQQEALDAILRDGLPARAEAWKYTSLRALERRRFVPASATRIDPTLLADIPAPRVVFVNGHFDATLSDLADLPAGLSVQPRASLRVRDDTAIAARPEDDQTPAWEPFARLNAVLAHEGALIRLEAGVQVATPLHLVCVGAAQDGAEAAWHLRHRIELQPGAQLTLVEHERAAGAHAHLGNSVLLADLAQDARLVHLRVQHAATQATLFAHTTATLADRAAYTRTDLELGAALSRHLLTVRLAGEEASLDAHGVLLADGRRHVDTRLGIEHIARNTRSQLVWRGLAGQRGRAVFHGGILIHAGADGSAAELANKNLLLSPDAEIDTQPVLEIHADEVKAAHGAAVGQLDPQALFYLRSRGLPQAQARTLLTAAFARDVLRLFPDEALRTQAEQALEPALARLGTA